ncbi:FecR family protein [Dyadobacter psychrotolerans]|uniref:FecR family protein n=1 Tax=Dyadobacter psychrotolerans TaxID=2541721 RepID=A0A4R5DUB9_9BACT|nr:FecR domain-containing protein [Dyadobacter psychrotolerans]TDE14533.1 FecR family protein [Dyadobacter psychrotolerans]
MKKIYDHFTCNDFILDEDFRAWVNGSAPEKDHLWASWMRSNPSRKTEIEKARRILNAIQIKGIAPEAEDVHQEWKKLESSFTTPTISEQEVIVNPFRRIFTFFNILAAASVLLVFFFAGRFLLPTTGETVISSVEQKTGNGQQRDIKLPDGTIVRLNAGSTITYPKVFPDTLREVTLSGEAFFSVAKNAKSPFIIHTGEIVTRVLGTSFNVRAYPENEDVQIAVVEGKVKVNTRLAPTEDKNSVCLTGNEMVTFQKTKGELIKSDYDEKEQIGWKDGILYFEKSDFISTVKKLERWYGVRIHIADLKKLDDPSWRFSGKFQHKQLEYILNVMSYPNRFSYTINKDTVNLQ